MNCDSTATKTATMAPACDDIDVAEQGGVVDRLAEAVIGEEHFGDDDAGQQIVELQDHHGEGRDERVAQGMP